MERPTDEPARHLVAFRLSDTRRLPPSQSRPKPTRTCSGHFRVSFSFVDHRQEMETSTDREARRICTVCEAACGLTATFVGDRVESVRANDNDVFSQGHICPKGIALAELHNDPRRLRGPLVRERAEWHEVEWSHALSTTISRLNAVRESHGDDAVALYLGNPTTHNIGLATGIGVIARALKSKQFYSAASVDQMPKQLANELMFGDGMAWPVPDIERCETLLIFGANPVVSNGSFWMIPKFRDHLRGLKARGGHMITVDPRRTETARVADEHFFIRPAGDAWLLIGLINLIRAERAFPDHYQVRGRDELFTALDRYTLDDVERHSGIEGHRIAALVGTLLQSKRAVAYGRIGTTLQANGTATSFLIEVLNMALGSLDAPGGAMFPEQPFADFSRDKSVLNFDRYKSRVSGRPEIAGQFPLSAMAEEMEGTSGDRVRALICFAGNPAMSTTDSPRLKRAIANLDLNISIDIYQNETNETADVILPGCSPFEECHYDQFFGATTFRNVARYSPAILDPQYGDEWEVTLAIAFGLKHGHAPSTRELAAYEDEVVAGTVARYVADPNGTLFGRDVQDVARMIGPPKGVERLIDLGIRAGRWGDHFETREGLTLKQLEDEPNGIDLGPVEARLDEVVKHPDKHIDLAPAAIIEAIDSLVPTAPQSGFQMIGRRNVKTNNSWLHGLERLQRGRDVVFVTMHEADAAALDITDGDTVHIARNGHTLRLPVETTTDIARGVVAFPHGHRQANYNDLVKSIDIDQPSGTGAMNGIEIEVMKAG